jgi:hypothetical protein
MIEALTLPNRTPQSDPNDDRQMLAQIFASMPRQQQLSALDHVGIQVRDKQDHLPENDGANDIPSWNQRRVTLQGKDNRPALFDKNQIIEVPVAIARGAEPAYISPDYDADAPSIAALSMNTRGGM